MNLDVVTLQLLILGVPGLVWAMLDASFRHSSQSGQFLFTVRALVFGLISFGLVAVAYRIFGIKFEALDFRELNDFARRTDELLWAVFVAVLLAMLNVANRKHSWLNRAFNRLGISDYTGCEDIWEYAFNRTGDNGEYVYFRDYSRELVYFGFVEAYSDRPDLREVLMEDVEVHTLDGEMLYHVERLYVAAAPNEILMEFPEEPIEDERPKNET